MLMHADQKTDHLVASEDVAALLLLSEVVTFR